METSPDSSLLFYQTEDGQTRIEVRLEDESVWLSQKLIAELFQKDIRTINEHIQNIYAEGELSPDPTIRNFRIVQKEEFELGPVVWFGEFDLILHGILTHMK